MSGNILHPKYRPDIDGLRAIAVLSVVFYHAFPNSLSGGFTGVDVFFVISGFLISTILFQNIDNGSFSIGDFYSRRIRRIFPALAIVLISVLVFGWSYLFTDELQQLGKHTASSAWFVQNFTLWKESGYFDNANETKPLLHIWSLGIEEQFYFVWPLLLWGASKLSKIYKKEFYKNLFYFFIIVLVFIISFILNLSLVKVDPTKTFYLPQYRFFELALGGILSWSILYPPKILVIFSNSRKNFFPTWLTKDLLQNALSFVGLLILFIVFDRFSKDTVFPGKKVLLPIFATVFILWAGPHSWLNRKFLSHKILVWFGLISFPLYLWHWPILSFGHIIHGETPSREFQLIAVAVSILLSWLTVKVIEKPFRFGNAHIGLKVTSLCLVIFGVGLMGYYLATHQPEPTILNESQKETEQIIANAIENCQKRFPKWVDMTGLGTDQWCSLQNETPTIALIGDSHSGHLYYGFVDKLKHTKESVVNFPSSCAAPFLNVTIRRDPKLPYRFNNGRLMNLGFDYIGKTPSIHTVYLAHNPDCSFQNAVDLENLNEKNDLLVLRNGLIRTLKFLNSKNINVVIVLDNPIIPYLPGKCRPRESFLDSFKASCDFEMKSPSRERYKKMVTEVVAAQFPKVKILDLSTLFCHSGKCNPVQNGKLLYPNSDGGHFNKEGSVFVSDYLLRAIK